MKRSDVFFQYTTTGWMMWNWLVAGLATGCTIVLFDGSPFKPHNGILWELAERHRFTRFGTSARYIQSLQEMGIRPASTYNLEALADLYSTGSPLSAESYEFVYEHVKKDLCLASITGGTDIVSLFAGHNHTTPVYKGEIQNRCLGMAVEAWSDLGKPLLGASGDLVCIKPFPCMPVEFWDDPERQKYRDAYFTTFQGLLFPCVAGFLAVRDLCVCIYQVFGIMATLYGSTHIQRES
jgi:acetoacetyl-CoA synthetase